MRSIGFLIRTYMICIC